MLYYYYYRIDLSKELALIKHVHETSAISFTIGVFLINGLSFKGVSATDLMKY